MGGDDAKATLFLQHLEPLKGAIENYCRRDLAHQNDLPDVIQAAIANAFRDFDLYSQGTNFRAWVFTYARHEIANANRRHHRLQHSELPLDDEVEAPPAELESLTLPDDLLEHPDVVVQECDSRLAKAILALPRREREVFLLQSIGEFKYREIADILELPIGTVMSSLARARARLRVMLADYVRERGG